MKIFIAGGGPAGLYAAYLLKRHNPKADITLVEQNAMDATFGFGVVFSDKALDFLRDDDVDTHALITPHMETWRDLTLYHKGETRIDGMGFAAIERLKLLTLLRERLATTGVKAHYNHVMTKPPSPDDYDLIVVADGVNSLIRNAHPEFGTSIIPLTNHFVWYGTTAEYDTLSQTFIHTDKGNFNAHHYRYAQGKSTFIVECDTLTYKAYAIDKMNENENKIFCETLFKDTLKGHSLITNKSTWRNFPQVTNAKWVHKNMVLLGDAQRSAHFSIGSGTRLALEDAIALDKAVTVGDLSSFEINRRPPVEKILSGAKASSAWYENFADHMQLSRKDFAWSYIQRSGRIDSNKLKRMAPEFMKDYE